jgi:hypothetical protein
LATGRAARAPAAMALIISAERLRSINWPIWLPADLAAIAK